MIEVINRLKAMKQWSDRIGSDEIAEINEMIAILEKEEQSLKDYKAFLIRRKLPE